MPTGTPKFVVQQARHNGWTTLAVQPDRATAEVEFAEAVNHRPRAIFRLIVLQSSDALQEGVFDWRLVRLYDPRRSTPPLVPPRPARPSARRGTARRETAAVRPLPLRFYLACIGVGAIVVAVAIWLNL